MTPFHVNLSQRSPLNASRKPALSRAKIRRWLFVAAMCALSYAALANNAQSSTSIDELESLFASDAKQEKEISAPETEKAAEADELIALPVKEPNPVKMPLRSGGIEEIIVTATKRPQSIRDLVGSIDAFSGDVLMEKGATGLEEILKYSPGVTVATGTDGESAQISFRGILSAAGGSLFGRTFGLFYDEVSLINPTFRGAQPDLDPWDMGSVEVLKGPQGTLFGGGALAGAVRYVPNQPEFEEFYGSYSGSHVQLGHSKDSGQGQRLSLNVPISNELAFRVAGGLHTRPGYVDDLHRGQKDINKTERTNGRVLARWEPTSRLAVKMQVMQRRFQLDDGTVADNLERPETNDRRLNDYTDSRVRIMSADIAYDFGAASLKGLFSQLDKSHFVDGDATAALNLQDTNQTAFQIIQTETSQPSFELRLTSSEPTQGGIWLGGWDYMFGVYLVRSDQLLEVFIDVTDPNSSAPVNLGLPDIGGLTLPRPDTLYSYGRADAIEQAVFFDLKRDLTNTLELNLGTRWFKQKSEALMYDEGANVEISRTEATPKDSGISPRFGLIWRFTDNMSLVTSAARGFRYGGVNVLPAYSDAPRVYKSDFLWNYEAGIRTDWLDRHLQIDLTAFYIDWTDLQISQFTEDDLFVFVNNVGAAKSQGVEFALKASLPWQLTLQSGASYTDARTDVEFESDSGTIPAGTRLPASPYYSGFVSLATTARWGSASLRGDINAAWQSGAKNDLQNSVPLPAYSTLGLSLGASWESVPLAPELRLNVTNLLNETQVAYARQSRDAFRTTFIQPRLATISLNLHF